MADIKLTRADIKIMKNFVFVLEEELNPYKYIDSLPLRQRKILMAAFWMGRGEATYETEQEWLRREQHNHTFPNDPIPEPDQRKGDMGALFSKYFRDHGTDDMSSELDQKSWQHISNCIRKTLIILLGREEGSAI